MLRSAVRVPEKVALRFEGHDWTYRDLVDAAGSAAAEMRNRGVRPGDRVAVVGRNSDRYLITWLATQLLGSVHVPVNFMLNSHEIGYVLEHSEAVLALADPALLDTVAQGAGDRGLGLELESLTVPVTGAAPPPAPDITPEVIAQIAYTSGTESRPKGVMLSHAALQAQYVSCIVAGEYRADDVFVHALPLYHCAQMHCFMMPALVIGATNVLLSAPDPAAVVGAIAENAATSFFAPPTVWIALLGRAEFDATAVGCLRKAYYGASIMPVQTVRSLAERLPELRLWNYYGQTELCPLATCLGPQDQLTKAGSAGVAVLNVETRVVDDEMRDVAVGEVGEVVHRSPQVTAGYFKDPCKTSEAFAGGWFHSGDLATRDDDGYITIVDRKKDMINSGGENVSSREVEETLYEHPAVAEVAVIGVPDEKWIEAVCAVVVVRDEADATADELVTFARERLAGFKVPKRIEFADELPKNPSGKILKRELRDRHAGSAAKV